MKTDLTGTSNGSSSSPKPCKGSSRTAMPQGKILARLTLVIGFALAAMNLGALTQGQLDAFRVAVLKYCNEARTNPSGFAQRNLDYHHNNGIDNGAWDDLMNRQPVAPLTLDSRLNDAALYYAKFMADNDVFDHECDGRTPWTRMQLFGYPRPAAENIGANTCYSNAEDDPGLAAINFVIQWIIDEGIPDVGHRNNILSPNLTTLGVGFWHSETSSMQNFGVQDFGN